MAAVDGVDAISAQFPRALPVPRQLLQLPSSLLDYLLSRHWHISAKPSLTQTVTLLLVYGAFFKQLFKVLFQAFYGKTAPPACARTTSSRHRLRPCFKCVFFKPSPTRHDCFVVDPVVPRLWIPQPSVFCCKMWCLLVAISAPCAGHSLSTLDECFFLFQT